MYAVPEIYKQKYYGEPDPGNTYAFRKKLKAETGLDNPDPNRTYFENDKEYVRLDKLPPVDNPIAKDIYINMSPAEQLKWVNEQKSIQKTRWKHYTSEEKVRAGYYSWGEGMVPPMPPMKPTIECMPEIEFDTSTAKNARAKLLASAEDIIDKYVALALGEEDEYEGNERMLDAAFKAVVPAMRLADDPETIIDGEDLDRKQTINAIVHKMNTGQITAEKANSMITAIENAYDLTEIEALLEERDG